MKKIIIGVLFLTVISSVTAFAKEWDPALNSYYLRCKSYDIEGSQHVADSEQVKSNLFAKDETSSSATNQVIAKAEIQYREMVGNKIYDINIVARGLINNGKFIGNPTIYSYLTSEDGTRYESGASIRFFNSNLGFNSDCYVK